MLVHGTAGGCRLPLRANKKKRSNPMIRVSSAPGVEQLIERAASRLACGDSSSPRLDAEVLMGHVLQRGRAWLYAHGESPVPQVARREFNSLVRLRSRGCPIAYLTGSKEFWSLGLTVSPATLVPRPETEHVVEEALRVIGEQSGLVSVWDVGTGCGSIAVALATTVSRVRVLATDRSPAALAVAGQNVRRQGVTDRVCLLAGDLDGPLGSTRFDLIVSNPPYIPDVEWASLAREVREFEPAEALCGGADGLSLIRRLISVAPSRLRQGGSLIFEIGDSTGGLVRELIAQSRELEFVRVVPDYAGHDRVVVARLP